MYTKNLQRMPVLRDSEVQVAAQMNKADQMLARMYALNILPRLYRNPAAVYYLYHFMSTSRCNFHEAMLYCKLDQIDQHLQNIAEQQEEIISMQEMNLAVNQEQRTIHANVLDEVCHCASNTADAALYAKIAADNTENMMWFCIIDRLLR